MSVTPPYCLSSHVALLSSAKTPKVAGDFGIDSLPTKTNVEGGITLISSQVDMRFVMAGYKLPLVALDGETWPDHQTVYLRFITAMGTAALILGHADNPRVQLGPGVTRGTGNVFQDLFNTELDNIFRPGRFPGDGYSMIRFRAAYYPGTAAERSVKSPKGPTSDFLENRHDPLAHLSVREIADRLILIQRQMRQLDELRDHNWDYMNNAFGFSKGFLL